MRGFVTAQAVGLLLVLAGCGGDAEPASEGRPTVAAIAAALAAVGGEDDPSYTAQEADCIATILVDSELSDSALRGLAGGVPGFEQSEADTTVYRGLVREISTCLVGSLPAPSDRG